MYNISLELFNFRFILRLHGKIKQLMLLYNHFSKDFLLLPLIYIFIIFLINLFKDRFNVIFYLFGYLLSYL